jgi:hypothetical protein
MTCPSAEPAPGAKLLAVVSKSFDTAYLNPAVQMSEESLLELDRDGIDLDNRLRFANSCVEDACVQWTGSRCGVIDNAIADLPAVSSVALLPRCDIRPSCRWFAQDGRAACRVCPSIIRQPKALQLESE